MPRSPEQKSRQFNGAASLLTLATVGFGIWSFCTTNYGDVADIAILMLVKVPITSAGFFGAAALTRKSIEANPPDDDSDFGVNF